MGYIFALLFVFISITVKLQSNFEGMKTFFVGSSLLIFLIFMGLNYNNADFVMYQQQYNSSVFFTGDIFDYMDAAIFGYSRDFGYTFLNKIFAECDFDYISFKFISSLIFLSLLIYISVKDNRNYYWVLLLYFIYPFFMDIMQVTNFYMEVIVNISLYIYVRSEKYRIIKFYLLIFLASTFHSGGLVYSLFIPFIKLLHSKRGRYIAYAFILLGLLVPLYGRFIQNNWLLFGVFLGSTDSSFGHYAGYMEQIMGIGYLKVYIYIVFMIILSQYMFRCVDKVESSSYVKEIVQMVSFIWLYIACFLPLSPLIWDFAVRLPRNCMLITYIAISLFFTVTPKYKKNIIGLLLAFSSIYFGLFDLYTEENIFNLWLIFEYNTLFDVFE